MTPAGRGSAAITSSASAICGTRRGVDEAGHLDAPRTGRAPHARRAPPCRSVDSSARLVLQPVAGGHLDDAHRVVASPVATSRGGGEVGQGGRLVHHLGVLGLQVEQVRLVRLGARSPTASRDDQRDEPVLDGVDRGRPDAAAGADTRRGPRVSTPLRVQRGGERRAEEGAGVLLDDHQLVVRRARPAASARPCRPPPTSCLQRRDLAEEHPAVDAAGAVARPGCAPPARRAAGRPPAPAPPDVQAVVGGQAQRAGRGRSRPASGRPPGPPGDVPGRQRAAEAGSSKRSRPRRHRATGGCGAGRPVSSSARSRIVSSGGPMSNIGSGSGRSASSVLAQRLRRGHVDGTGLVAHHAVAARTVGGNQAAAHLEADQSGSRASGSPQPPPPQVTKCSTSPALDRHVVDLAARSTSRGAVGALDPLAAARARLAAVDAPRIGEPAVVVDRDRARPRGTGRRRRRRCRRGAAPRRRCR